MQAQKEMSYHKIQTKHVYLVRGFYCGASSHHGMVPYQSGTEPKITLPTGPKMDITEIRYRNFKSLFEQFKEMVRRDDPGAPDKGMLKLFGDRVGVREAYMSHINTKYKGIGPTTARKIEEAFKLSHGWMDQQHERKARAEQDATAPVHVSAEQAPEPTDADELAFLETAIQLYRNDPIRAQTALLKAMSSKFKS
jgi:hypothetical protein